MNKYTIYFELFGKKMKTTVDAFDESNAKEVLADKIIFHKIELTEDNDSDDEMWGDNPITNDPQVKKLMDILGMNKTNRKK